MVVIPMNVKGNTIKHIDFSASSSYDHTGPFIKKALSKGMVAETVLGISTVLVCGLLFVSLSNALHNNATRGAVPF
jgi:hypothetical protein